MGVDVVGEEVQDERMYVSIVELLHVVQYLGGEGSATLIEVGVGEWRVGTMYLIYPVQLSAIFGFLQPVFSIN